MMAAACNLRLQTQPEIPLRPRYLVLMNDPRDTDYVLVCDIKLGMRSLFANCNPMPAAVFASGAFPFRLDMGVVQVGQIITLELTSMRPSAITVNAVLMCEKPEEKEYVQRLGPWRSQADRDKDGPR